MYSDETFRNILKHLFLIGCKTCFFNDYLAVQFSWHVSLIQIVTGQTRILNVKKLFDYIQSKLKEPQNLKVLCLWFPNWVIFLKQVLLEHFKCRMVCVHSCYFLNQLLHKGYNFKLKQFKLYAFSHIIVLEKVYVPFETFNFLICYYET